MLGAWRGECDEICAATREAADQSSTMLAAAGLDVQVAPADDALLDAFCRGTAEPIASDTVPAIARVNEAIGHERENDDGPLAPILAEPAAKQLRKAVKEQLARIDAEGTSALAHKMKALRQGLFSKSVVAVLGGRSTDANKRHTLHDRLPALRRGQPAAEPALQGRAREGAARMADLLLQSLQPQFTVDPPIEAASASEPAMPPPAAVRVGMWSKLRHVFQARSKFDGSAKNTRSSHVVVVSAPRLPCAPRAAPR